MRLTTQSSRWTPPRTKPHSYTGFDSTKSFLGESTARSVVGSLQLSTTRSKFDETGFGKTIADLHAFEKTILWCLPSLEMDNSIFTSLVRVNPFNAEKTTSFFLNLRLSVENCFTLRLTPGQKDLNGSNEKLSLSALKQSFLAR